MRRTLGGAAVTAAVLALTIGSGPAQAGAPLDQGTFHDVDPGHSSADDPEWPCTDLGFDVTISSDVHGSFRFGPRKPGGVNYGRDTSTGTFSFSANGSSYTDYFSTNSRDMQVTENEDGSLSIIVMGTGLDRWFLNGELLFFDSGQIRFELLITDPGQPGEKVHFVQIIRDSNGRNDGPTRDFCVDIAEFLAPAP